MTLTVSILKDGKTIVSKILDNPQPGDVTDAISELLSEFRDANPSQPIWPIQIDVR